MELLKNEIDSLKMPQPNVHWPLLPPSSEQASKESSKFSGDFGEQTTRSVRTAPQSGHNPVPTASHDSKFNVVLYGVEEYRSGLSRPA